ncbi:MAG TPA: sporulation membrane protein YtaF [Firmicutes bacterium]|nr:sporulation membrane protein YtaF [Bacillota bacterium]
MWSTFLMSVALSIDGLLVGFSYGARGIRIPGCSLAVIALCTGAGMGASMGLGYLVGDYVGWGLAKTLGGGALVAMGLWQLLQALAQRIKKKQPSHSPLLARWRLASLGIVVQIIRDPEAADQDASGEIDPREAIALGTVLGIDTLAAGFATSLLGFGPLLILAVTFSLLVLTWFGLLLGKTLKARPAGETAPLLPALLLILIGLWELW